MLFFFLTLECPTTQISPYKGKCFHPSMKRILFTPIFKSMKMNNLVAKTATTLYFKAITQNLLPDSSCLKLRYMLHLMKSHMLKLQKGKKNKRQPTSPRKNLKGRNHFQLIKSVCLEHGTKVTIEKSIPAVQGNHFNVTLSSDKWIKMNR